MADKWVDSAATGLNNGSSPANAWTVLKTALEYGHSAGDKIWVRRTLTQNIAASSTITPSGRGTPAAPIQVIGWPRTTLTGTATFTNNSTTVSSVSITVTARIFLGRWIKCDADGHWYLITNYLSSSSFTIDRPFGGTTASSSAFTVQEDEDYATRPSAGYGWDADTQQLPQIQPSTLNFYCFTWSSNAGFWWAKNIFFYRATNGGFCDHQFSPGGGYPGLISYLGCMFNWVSSHTGSGSGVYSQGSCDNIHLERFVIGGMTGGNTSVGINLAGSAAMQRLSLRDGAIHGENIGVQVTFDVPIALDNVNIGIEVSNAYANFRLYSQGQIIVGKDVMLGQSTEAYKFRLESVVTPQMAIIPPFVSINIENYQKDRNKIYRLTGQLITSMGVDSSTTDPRKRTGGSDIVLIADLATPSGGWGPDYQQYPAAIFDQRIFQLGGTSKTYRIYLQATTAIASGLVKMEVEFMDFYSSSTLWTNLRKVATAAVSARSGNTDWSQYVEVTGVNPPSDCAVRVRLFNSYNVASHYLYIDPKVIVS